MDAIKKKKRKGFTLIELIVVIAIIGILAAIMIPKLSGFQDKARRTQVVTDAHQVTTAIESLLTESSTGTIAGATVMDITTATNGSDKVLKMAGITAGAAAEKTISYNSDGSFILTEKVNGKTYTANRTAGLAPVVSDGVQN
ncbi:prepilin-type N-terminal cleavage/methylation domain-containing protein [Clostridium estertheticum]|nr:prepilin-type N-terminal cleavage/methylation domain-containing protein [Clostridium estertheticum]